MISRWSIQYMMLVLATLSPAKCVLAYSGNRNVRSVPKHHQELKQQQPSRSPPSRRDFFNTVIVSTARAAFVGTIAAVSTISATPSLVQAAEEIVLPTKEKVTTTFDAIRYELQNPQGGVTYMQGRIDEKDFEGLMEFTKTYDLEMRKLRMGRAKKLLQSKELKEQATAYANAVTFDLIGMNRNSRKGQENQEAVNKYLQELREDVTKFLSLESTIETEG